MQYYHYYHYYHYYYCYGIMDFSKSFLFFWKAANPTQGGKPYNTNSKSLISTISIKIHRCFSVKPSKGHSWTKYSSNHDYLLFFLSAIEEQPSNNHTNRDHDQNIWILNVNTQNVSGIFWPDDGTVLVPYNGGGFLQSCHFNAQFLLPPVHWASNALSSNLVLVVLPWCSFPPHQCRSFQLFLCFFWWAILLRFQIQAIWLNFYSFFTCFRNDDDDTVYNTKAVQQDEAKQNQYQILLSALDLGSLIGIFR